MPVGTSIIIRMLLINTTTTAKPWLQAVIDLKDTGRHCALLDVLRVFLETKRCFCFCRVLVGRYLAQENIPPA